MKKLGIIILAFMLVGFVAAPAPATIDLFEYAFNIDGAVSNITGGDPLPGGVNVVGFDDLTGLGSITVTLSGAGMHYVGLFVDHEIDEAINTWFNETGDAVGAPAAGQSWEIDAPGYQDSGNIGTGGLEYVGDIYDNFALSALDNQIFYDDIDAQSLVPPEDDVSMAMGWDFSGSAVVSFLLSETAPVSGFYLSQTDPDSDATIYFSSALRPDGGDAPEPATLLLLGSGLVALAGLGRNRFKKS